MKFKSLKLFIRFLFFLFSKATTEFEVITQAGDFDVPGALEKVDLAERSTKIASRRSKTHIAHVNLKIVHLIASLQVVTYVNVKIRVVELKLISIVYNVVQSRRSTSQRFRLIILFNSFFFLFRLKVKLGHLLIFFRNNVYRDRGLYCTSSGCLAKNDWSCLFFFLTALRRSLLLLVVKTLGLLLFCAFLTIHFLIIGPENLLFSSVTSLLFADSFIDLVDFLK